MDADLEAMRSVPRFYACVQDLIEPLLSHRDIAPMPCKHHRTFELAAQRHRERCEEQGIDIDDDEPNAMPDGYCDCGKFRRRNELWEIAELTVKRGLTRTQMRELAYVLLLGTRSTFTYNHVNRTMLGYFNGVYEREIKALHKRARKGKGKGEGYDGKSLAAATYALVAEWQFRMMPNA